jgi:hypothetical protein
MHFSRFDGLLCTSSVHTFGRALPARQFEEGMYQKPRFVDMSREPAWMPASTLTFVMHWLHTHAAT